jgi:hypothetical protein
LSLIRPRPLRKNHRHRPLCRGKRLTGTGAVNVRAGQKATAAAMAINTADAITSHGITISVRQKPGQLRRRIG